MALNGKAHKKMYFSIPLKKRKVTWLEQNHTLPLHTYYRRERERRQEPEKAPGRTLSIEHHRGPSNWPLCQAFFWGMGMQTLLSVIVTHASHPVSCECKRGRIGKARETEDGLGFLAGAGMLSVVQRHSSVHNSRCSENTWRGKKKVR